MNTNTFLPNRPSYATTRDFGKRFTLENLHFQLTGFAIAFVALLSLCNIVLAVETSSVNDPITLANGQLLYMTEIIVEPTSTNEPETVPETVDGEPLPYMTEIIVKSASANEPDLQTNRIFLPIISKSNEQNTILATPTSEPVQRSYDHLRGVTKGECAGMFEIVGTEYCTHGPDTPPPGVDIEKPVEPMIFAAGTDVESVYCDGDGVSGNRVQVIYVRAENQPDRFAEFQSSIQQWVVDVDKIYDASANETGGTRHIRFVHDEGCQAVVLNEVIPAGTDASFAESISALQAKGHNRQDRKYLMFVDTSVFCGIGGMYSDESTSVTNRNNIGPSYARVDNGCWGERVAAHELMHNFGGVQFGAPNSSGGYHCTDDWDIMCYSDAPKYPKVNVVCPDPAHESRLDCNHDDYYHTNPPAGSYLATHWNPAFNQFLIWENQPIPTVVATPTPAPIASANCTYYQASALPVSLFDQQTVVAKLNVPDDFALIDVNLINLQIEHTFVADLETYLVSPMGTKRLLFKGVGVTNRDFRGTWLDDNAGTSINDGEPPFSGSYRPALPLSAFNGESVKGEWQLQITDTSFRDAGILTAWGLELCRGLSDSVSPTPVVTNTPTGSATPVPTETLEREVNSQLDIILNVAPQSIQNFRFAINGLTVSLDDAATNDGDALGKKFSAMFKAGTYVIAEKLPNTWVISDINCTKAGIINLELENPTVTLNLAENEKVTCTFSNARNVSIRTQAYEDVNKNKVFDTSEPSLAKRTVKLYSTEGALLQSEESNEYGKANFNGLSAGESYWICQEASAGWQISIPASDANKPGQSCYSAMLMPGQIAIARFGYVRSTSGKVSAVYQQNVNEGLEIITMPDVIDDNDGYGNEITEDTDLTTPVFGSRIYLPLVTK